MNPLKFNSVKFTIFITIFETMVTIYLMNALSLLVVDDTELLIRNVGILIVLYIAEKSLLYWRLRSIQVSGYYIRRQLNDRVSNYYQKISYREFKEKTVGERISLYVNDIPYVTTLIFAKLMEVIHGFSLLIFALLALLRISPIVFVVALILVIFKLFITKIFESKLAGVISQGQQAKEIFLGSMTETLSGLFVFISTCALPKFMRKSEKDSERYADCVTETEIFAGKMSAILAFSGNLMTIITLSITSYLAIEGKVPVGTLLSVIGIVPLLAEAAQMLLVNYTFQKTGRVFYKERFAEIEEFYSEHLTRPFIRKKKEVDEIRILPSADEIDEIRVENLKIRYDNRVIPIKDITFSKGKKYIVVGESGSGKSSLLKTILGENQSYDGRIWIDGKEKEKETTLYHLISYMSQESFLFKDSLGSNIRIGNDEADIQSLLEKVALAEFNPEYPIEEEGKNLSGGQKQRIALARTLACHKNILFWMKRRQIWIPPRRIGLKRR